MLWRRWFNMEFHIDNKAFRVIVDKISVDHDEEELKFVAKVQWFEKTNWFNLSYNESYVSGKTGCFEAVNGLIQQLKDAVITGEKSKKVLDFLELDGLQPSIDKIVNDSMEKMLVDSATEKLTYQELEALRRNFAKQNK
jgi:hypothetical protein